MFTRVLTKMGYTKEETSWILYDIGNSAQVLTTCTVIFPPSAMARSENSFAMS